MTKASTRIDLYQVVTDKIIKLLEHGVAPWKCTWSQYGAAKNYATGHVYKGINQILMNLTPYPIPYFMSFKQIKKQGGKVKKGAKAEMVLFYKTLFKTEHNEFVGHQKAMALQQMAEEVQFIPMLKYYNVFNIADVDGIEINIPQVELKAHHKIAKCEAIIKAVPNPPKLIFQDANRAFYHPESDELNMPEIGQFDTPEDYYCTYFHELTHSTGHKSRLNREGVANRTVFGSPQYSKEELVAEMGAAFLAAYSGIDYDTITENNAAYLQGWLGALKADKKLIFKAAAEAQKTVDYLLNVERTYSE